MSLDAAVINEDVQIRRLSGPVSDGHPDGQYAQLWIREFDGSLEVDGKQYKDVAHSMIFLHKNFNWRVNVGPRGKCQGFVLYLSERIFHDPHLSRLKVNDLRILRSGKVHVSQLSPGIESRVASIVEMLDELLTSRLNNRESAILSLLNALFVYCESMCNIRASLGDQNKKARIVYQFKTLINKHIAHFHNVTDYASRLHVSAKYLNECVQEVLRTSAKSLIIEQLVMRARRDLKFTDKNIKQISYDLGFNSPDYFSYFCKKHIGRSPLEYRRV